MPGIQARVRDAASARARGRKLLWSRRLRLHPDQPRGFTSGAIGRPGRRLSAPFPAGPLRPRPGPMCGLAGAARRRGGRVRPPSGRGKDRTRPGNQRNARAALAGGARRRLGPDRWRGSEPGWRRDSADAGSRGGGRDARVLRSAGDVAVSRRLSLVSSSSEARRRSAPGRRIPPDRGGSRIFHSRKGRLSTTDGEALPPTIAPWRAASSKAPAS
jgi:hypothetical protein